MADRPDDSGSKAKAGGLMATYYVGKGGNNSNAGTSWAQRKLTLNGAEDIPVAAGDTVYVGAGTYRELLTCDVSGSSGSPITYIGDYDGSHTDGTGGVVRITGSDDDSTASGRDSCVYAATKSYRTFKGFYFDGADARLISAIVGVQGWTVEQCYFGSSGGNAQAIYFASGGTPLCNNNTVRNCVFNQGGAGNSAVGVVFYHNSEINSSGNVVENCIFLSGYQGIQVISIGDVIVRNCLIANQVNAGIRTLTINTSNRMVVNNCIFWNNLTGISSAGANQVTENYNNFYGNTTARTNCATGANSTAYLMYFDARWFFEMVNGGSMLTPFDLASYSQLINVAGTSPTTADMRGTTVQGTQREWGALEYDSTLDIEAGSGGGGAVSIQPLSGRLGL